MIQTLEQWKYIRGWGIRGGHGHRLSADDRAATIETLEALREVARYCKYDVMLEEDGEYEFDEIFPDLPSWLLEDSDD